MWSGEGCIIRSIFLGMINYAFDRNQEVQNILLDAFFKSAVKTARTPGGKQSA